MHNKFWVNLEFTCCCVRKGTPLLIPPAGGGTKGGKISAGGGNKEGRIPDGEGIKVHEVSNSNKLNKNDISEFRAPEKKVLDIKNESTFYQIKPIEEIQPGDYVFGHDLMSHRVIKTFRRHFKGPLLGIMNEKIFYGIGQKHTQVCKMITQDVNEDVFDLEVEKVNSYLTLHAAVHNSII